MRGYFEGWYFKQHNQNNSLAFIPAYHIDADGRKSSSLQIIADTEAYWITFPYNSFSVDSKNFCINVGRNSFSAEGIILDIDDRNITARGRLHFGTFTPLKYDIMGPFKYVPFMECRHKVISMYHLVTGLININGKELSFRFDPGYIEGDSGSSFPKCYIWTQCVHKNASIMLSVANIPFMGACFIGVIGVVVINGREYRLATYKGARVLKMEKGVMVVRQGKYTLRAQLISKNDTKLRAPSRGDMIRFIKESSACTAGYRFEENGVTLLNFITDKASFEYEY